MATVLGLALPFALIFMAISGQLTVEGFLFGYIVSIFVLAIGQAQNLKFNLLRAPVQLVYLVIYSLRLAWDIFASSVEVTRMVFARDIKQAIDPGIVKIDTQDPNNNEIITAMSSHGITITPGQLVLDITEEDGHTMMHVHNLHVQKSISTIEKEQTQRLKIIKRILGYDD